MVRMIRRRLSRRRARKNDVLPSRKQKKENTGQGEGEGEVVQVDEFAVNYHFNYETSLWEPGLAIQDHNNRILDMTRERVSVNPHEINVMTPNGPCILNFKLNGKLYQRGYNNIVNFQDDHYYDPNWKNFMGLEYWLQKIFPGSSLNKLRNIMGEIIYPSDSSNSSQLIVNFIIQSSNKNKNSSLINTIVNLLKKLPEGNKIYGLDDITTSGMIRHRQVVTLAKPRRTRWGGMRRHMVVRKMVPVVKYDLREWYVLNEKNNFANKRFVYVQPELNTFFSSQEFIRTYLSKIRPKKNINEMYGANPIKIIKKKMILPSLILFSKNEPLDFNRIGKLRSIYKVMTIECKPADDFNSKEFDKNIDEFTKLLHNWIIHGILNRLERAHHESIGFIDAILGKPEKVEPSEPKLYFMGALN